MKRSSCAGWPPHTQAGWLQQPASCSTLRAAGCWRAAMCSGCGEGANPVYLQPRHPLTQCLHARLPDIRVHACLLWTALETTSDPLPTPNRPTATTPRSPYPRFLPLRAAPTAPLSRAANGRNPPMPFHTLPLCKSFHCYRGRTVTANGSSRTSEGAESMGYGLAADPGSASAGRGGGSLLCNAACTTSENCPQCWHSRDASGSGSSGRCSWLLLPAGRTAAVPLQV